MLPPIRAALLPHILRANYITMRDINHSRPAGPELPLIEANEWKKDVCSELN